VPVISVGHMQLASCVKATPWYMLSYKIAFPYENKSHIEHITWIAMRRYKSSNPFQQTFNISCDANDTIGIKFWQFIR
jgi:hypothetical protein